MTLSTQTLQEFCLLARASHLVCICPVTLFKVNSISFTPCRMVELLPVFSQKPDIHSGNTSHPPSLFPKFPPLCLNHLCYIHTLRTRGVGLSQNTDVPCVLNSPSRNGNTLKCAELRVSLIEEHPGPRRFLQLHSVAPLTRNRNKFMVCLVL